MAAMVRDQPEAEEDLPEMDRDLWDRDLRLSLIHI